MELTQKTSDFNYYLPEQLIAQHPADRRDQSRLMVVHRKSAAIDHCSFSDIGNYFSAGDVLVVNDTKVIPARLIGRKPSGARVEVFLINEESANQWRCLVNPGRKLKPGDFVDFGELLTAEIIDRNEDGTRLVKFDFDGDFIQVLTQVGQVPLPPYIHREQQNEEDRERYQTIYASHAGAVAAPTAGLHFTPDILQQLESKGVRIARVTLHVGIGTFKPVTAERVADHKMDAEWYEIKPESAAIINGARPDGRIIAVGTTSVRTLESAWNSETSNVLPGRDWTDIFITPGYKFNAVDALLTNFHLPKSTLIMLVSAFAGKELVFDAYQTAVTEQYRFYSYGDCMFLI